jgi:ABC-type multidrug transport system ATPase subunit
MKAVHVETDLEMSEKAKTLSEMDFSVRPGEFQALMGENGAWKSTLSKVQAGIYPLDEVRIALDGAPFVPRFSIIRLLSGRWRASYRERV